MTHDPSAPGATFAPGEERWLPVPGYEGRYDVSDHGRVRSWMRKWKNGPLILRPGSSNYGHMSVAFGRRNGGTFMVHYLVALAFLGPRPPKMEVRHLDGDPKNNRLDNLRWGTRGDNIRDAVRHGTWHSEKRKAGWRSPAQLAGLVKARAAVPRGDLLATLAKARRIRWGKQDAG